MTGEVCPLCRCRPRAVAERCTECQGDLRLMLVLSDLANWHFNNAVAAARATRWRTAGEHLAVTLALAPDDIGALILLGKVRYHQRQPDQTIELWNRARELAPDRTDISRAIETFTAGIPPSPDPRDT